MAIPNCQHIVEQLSREFPDEWRKAHNPSGGGPETEAFIRRLAWVLHTTVSPNFGLNGKRGVYSDLSDDVVNWIGEGPGHDPATGRPVTVIDVIGGAGGPDPRPMWMPFSDLPGPGGWVKPGPVDGASSGGGGTPPTPAPPAPVPGPDYTAKLDTLLEAVAVLRSRVDAVSEKLDVIRNDASIAAHESLNAAVRASDIKTQIDNLPKPGSPTSFPAYEGRVFGSKVRLEPK